LRARLPSASALRLCSLPLGQDITPPELVQADATCSRSIVAFGYVRGTFLKPRMRVHVPGLGDFSMGSVTGITDPCPFPSTQKRRRLNEREKLLHAPMANLGELTYDADAVYVDIPDSAVRFSDKPSAAASKSGGGLGGGDGDGSEDGGSDEEDEGDAEHAEDGGVAMVKRLHKLGESSALNSQLASGGLRLFAGGAQLPGRGAGGGYEEAGDDGEGDSEDEDEDEESDDEEEEEDSDSEDEGGGRIVEVAEGQQILDDDDDDGSDEEEGGESDDEESDEESDEDPEEEEEEGGAEWKSKLLERAAERYNTRRINWSPRVWRAGRQRGRRRRGRHGRRGRRQGLRRCAQGRRRQRQR
jgi:ribosome biogenesis protein BMS1